MIRLLLGLFLGGGRHYGGSRRRGGFGSALKGRLFLALIVFGIAYFSYKKGSRQEVNSITNETQTVGLTVDQEIKLGLRAAPQMEMQHKGKVSEDHELTRLVKEVGRSLVVSNGLNTKTEYKFTFNLLADEKAINAFALPGGNTYITYALLSRFDKSNLKDQLAGVMGHEIAHVIARHSNEHATKAKLTGGVASAVGVLIGGNDRYGGGGGNRQISMLLNKILNTKYGREDELESDRLGLVFMYRAGYDPLAMIRVMEILHANSGGSSPPEFLSTHPSSKNRIREIRRISENLMKMDRSMSLAEMLKRVEY